MFKSFYENHPDIAFHHTSFIIDSPQSISDPLDDSGEGVFQDPGSGSLHGSILLVDPNGGGISENHPGLPSRLTGCCKALNSLCTSVVRIFAIYENSVNEKQITYAGSGFRVSPIHFVTAQHVVKPFHKKEDGIYELKRLGFSPFSSALVTFEAPRAIQFKFPEPKRIDVLPDFKNTYTIGAHGETWSINDFCFLELDEKSTPDPVYSHCHVPCALPVISPSASPAIVIGYPAQINCDKFIIDYIGEENAEIEQAKSLYHEVCHLTKAFENKIISYDNDSVPITNKDLTRHKCPSLRGTSGGMFLQLICLQQPIDDQSPAHETEDLEMEITALGLETAGVSQPKKQRQEQKQVSLPATPIFSGIHVGGSQKMGNNFCYSTSLPEFALEYTWSVLLSDQTEEFVRQNSHCLNQFYSYHEETLKSYLYPPELEKLKARLTIS